MVRKKQELLKRTVSKDERDGQIQDYMKKG